MTKVVTEDLNLGTFVLAKYKWIYTTAKGLELKTPYLAVSINDSAWFSTDTICKTAANEKAKVNHD